VLLSLKINVNEYVKARLLEVIDELYLTIVMVEAGASEG